MSRLACALIVFSVGLLPRSAPALPFERTEQRVPCSRSNPLRDPFFGDLHVHTALSLDASTQDTRNRPADAYRFARGAPLGLQPYDREGRPTRTVQLTRPLDFAAVTDHAETFGEVRSCQTPGLPGHDAPICLLYRWLPRLAFFLMNGDMIGASEPHRYGFCGTGGRDCLEAARTPWQEVQQAAEAAYDRTAACRFTSFVGYEWTRAPGSMNLHRNVIFRNATVPRLPISAVDATDPATLWGALRGECLDGLPGCDVLVIPHNSNLSHGLMFQPIPTVGDTVTAAAARTRAAMEPLIEIMQHKGQSECQPEAGAADELCGFEGLPYDRFSGKYQDSERERAQPASFARYALAQGLRAQRAVGANPFKVGFIGSTDTHIAAAGLTDERTHVGHGGASQTLDPNGITLPDDLEYNPGGTAVLWAEENSRDALFAAMRRRETYATSGPRIVVRFFGGWSFASTLCSDATLAATGYAKGVPMGGDLPNRPRGAGAPSFVLSALRDPGTTERPGAPLQRMQIVKGWLDGDAVREAVIDTAAPADGDVDPTTCTVRGRGADQLCTVWTDPDFDPTRPAYYYARVVEVPTCRWQTFVCNTAQVHCDDPTRVPPGLVGCCDASAPRTIQERAWTSPIWYTPPPR